MIKEIRLSPKRAANVIAVINTTKKHLPGKYREFKNGTMNLEAEIREINRKMDQLLKPKPSWVTAETIMELTGWDKNKMNAARRNKTINYKVNKSGGYLYDLNSVHPYLIIKKTA